MPSDTAFAPPSMDPADLETMPGAFRAILGKFLQNIDDCIPAVVTAVTADRTRATVKPMVAMVTTDNARVSRAAVPSVPILTMGCAGFVVSFPIKPGDLGWLKASDRDTSLFLQSLSEQPPNTRRMHSFQDAVFIPDILRQWALAEEDADRLVIQSVDGTQRIAIGSDQIKITATLLTIDAPHVALNGELDVTGGPIKVNGVVVTVP